MKRIVIIALTFVLTACLFAGCRRNDMSGDTGNSSIPGASSTGSTEASSLPMPSISGGISSTPTDAMDDTTSTEDAMPRSPIPGMMR